jgi:hypothetical protein
MSLEERVLWELVDSQHILEAYHIARAKVQQGNLTEEEYRQTFSMRKARFVVYNNPSLPIEASTSEDSQGWGIQKGCLYKNFSPCKCVKQVHFLNKIKYDFIKCGFALLHL